MLTELMIIAALLLINAFFALSEMAIVSASKPLLQEYAKNGKKAAITALKLKDSPGRFLSTVQVGITLVGILAGAYGGASIAQRLIEPLNQFSLINPYGKTVAVVIVVSCITYLSVVIGELVPKQAALNNAEKLAMRVARIMAVLAFICTPLVVVLEISGKILMIILRIKTTERSITATEIKAVIAQGAASGAIEEDEHKVMRRVIGLGDRDVKSIMTHRSNVSFIDVTDTLDIVQRKILEAKHSCYPVYQGDKTKVIGMVRTKEMLAKALSDQDFSVKKYVESVHFMNESASCLDALNMFRKQSIHIAGVLDEYGSFEGLFTTSDLLEAIVGVIPSNYDNEDIPHIHQREDGSWLLDGLTPIEEIQMTIGMEAIPLNKEYKTIAGFILTEFRSSIKAGTILNYAGYRFEIVDMDGLRIDKILVSKLPAE